MNDKICGHCLNWRCDDYLHLKGHCVICRLDIFHGTFTGDCKNYQDKYKRGINNDI